MIAGDDIAPEERLGRGVFSRGDAKRARRRNVRLNVFLEREGNPRLSVDRLDLRTKTKAVDIAERVGAARDKPFCGWAVVTAEDATRSGRQVEATPLLDNARHADIVLPDLAVEDREEQKRHAQELADAAEWCEPDRDP